MLWGEVRGACWDRWCTRGTGRGTKVVRAPLHGVPVLRVALDPEGFWARRRAGRAARRLVRQGAARVLVPEDFPFWEELSRAGLRPVDPLPLLGPAPPLWLWRCCAAKGGPAAGGGGPAGSRAERDLVRAAEELCPRVRDLCLSVQTGGGELERYLHRQYGVALRPDWDGVQAAIRFDPRAEEAGQAVLSLFGPEADLAGLAVSVPGLERQKEGQWLPLLEILWETGRLERTDLEFT